MTWTWRRGLLLAAGLFLGPAIAQAQQPPRAGVLPDRVARDTTARDSLAVTWRATDSVMAALMSRAGYEVTRYQGRAVTFDARQRALFLLPDSGSIAVVQRGSRLVTSDSTLFYREGTGQASSLGNYRLRDAASGQADIVGVGQANFDLRGRSGMFTGARLVVNNGEEWIVSIDTAVVIAEGDTLGKGTVLWAHGSRFTSCQETKPHYHFRAKEFKRTANNTIVGRPAILYIEDIPVAWLPFFFQNVRSGRRSGILTPRFGLSDIVRNSPAYRRNIENLGYYWALSDYMNFLAALDWRSGAGTNTAIDPGWVRVGGELDYQWRDRFVTGSLRNNYTRQNNGLTELATSWNHSQRFAREAALTVNINHTTSTRLRRQNTFDPAATLQTIRSAATFTRSLGPAKFSIGGTQTQYPGRDQVDRAFPSISITTPALRIAEWFSWTPSFSYSANQSLKLDQPSPFALQYRVVDGLVDTVRLKRNAYNSAIRFDTPVEIFGFDLGNSFTVTSDRFDFPQQVTMIDVVTGDSVGSRIYNSVYSTKIDWTPQFTLPVTRNRLNITPSVALANVDPGAFWIRTERTNGQFVSQSKRVTLGLSAAPSVFGFFPGFGPFERIRHSVNPTFGYTYAPRAKVSDEYLAATGRSRKGYLGSLPQNAVTVGLSQVFEGKLRTAEPDSGQTAAPADKVRLLGINLSSLTYDLERLRAPEITNKQWWRALTTERFTASLSSDLLPGVDFSANYSLFQGSTTSDTALFKPYLEGVSGTFSFSRERNPLILVARMFGRAVPEAQRAPIPSPQPPGTTAAEEARARELAAQPVAGSRTAGNRIVVPPAQGWRMSFTFSTARPRPPVGGNVIDFDPRSRCEEIAGNNPFLLDTCLAQTVSTGPDLPIESDRAGAVRYRIPRTTSLGADVAFQLTERWASAWRTNYDFERSEFASHVVSLQRDMHDWRATFGFTQSPNGNFAFNFSVGLKAQPDLKFDYNRATVRAGQGF